MTVDGEHPPGARLIGGRYRLAERLDSGSTGTVWRAVDEAAGEGRRQVAVTEPLLPGDPADDEDSRRIARRLSTQARAAARVRHPCAVTVLDVVTEGHVPWVVTELVEGESLREVLRRGPLPPAEAARIGLCVLGALRAAHAVGIVHRDLKPAGVLLESGTGRVVVTGFGTGDGRPGGTPDPFVAPERAAGPGAGPAGDLWSLGALLRAALGAGQDPDPARLGTLGPLLERLHAAAPEARPGAPEVAAVLRDYLGLPPVPEPEPAPRRPAPASAPRPADIAEPTAADVAEPTAAGTVEDASAPAPEPPSASVPEPPSASAPGLRRRGPRAPRTALGLLLAKKPDSNDRSVRPGGQRPDQHIPRQ